MEKLRNEELAKQPFGEFFNYYSEIAPSAPNTYPEFERYAVEYLSRMDADAQQVIDTPFDFSEDEVIFSDDMKSSGRLQFMIGFENLFSALKNVLTNQRPDTTAYHGYKRQASPPLSAYEYVGHNDLNISRSKKSYSLLFE